MASSSVSERALRRVFRPLAAALLLLALAAGCKSPLDPDTPRLRFTSGDTQPPDTAKPSPWLRAEITFSASNSGAQWQHAADSSWAFIDTTRGHTAVRMMYAGTMRPPYLEQQKFLHSFLVIDTLVADGISRSLTTDPSSGTGALFRVVLAKDSSTVVPVETIVTGDPASNGYATLTLFREGGKRAVHGTFVAYAQKYRISLDGTFAIVW